MTLKVDILAMDVLKPDILVIDGIRYRINPGNYLSRHDKLEETYLDNYEEMVLIETPSEGEEDIEEAEDGRFKASFHIAKTYFPYIIGSKGATKKRLETETRSKILIPKPGHGGDIVITAASKKSVASARRRIRMMMISSRKRQSITHFTSIAMTGLSFLNGFLSFKSEVLEKCGGDRGITEKLFQTPEKLHFTIGVMVLFDEVDRNEAAKGLEECKEAVIRPLLGDNRLRLVMCGIDYMNDNPSEVNILYGKVICKDNDTILHDMAEGINLFFAKKGLLDQERNRVKIHVTLMNTTYLMDKEKGNRTNKNFTTFDATNILKNFQDYYFGEEEVTSIQLSIIGSSSESGYYLASAAIDIH